MTTVVNLSEPEAKAAMLNGVRFRKAQRGVPYPYVYFIRGRSYVVDLPHTELMRLVRDTTQA